MHDILPCPYCDSGNVDRRYELVDGHTQPGCLDCRQTRPVKEWVTLVAGRLNGSDIGM
jgi:transposase-like protein